MIWPFLNAGKRKMSKNSSCHWSFCSLGREMSHKQPVTTWCGIHCGGRKLRVCELGGGSWPQGSRCGWPTVPDLPHNGAPPLGMNLHMRMPPALWRDPVPLLDSNLSSQTDTPVLPRVPSQLVLAVGLHTLLLCSLISGHICGPWVWASPACSQVSKTSEPTSLY